VPEGGFVAILEVGGFNDWLLKLLAEYACHETILIQPEKRSRKKTDRRDAKATAFAVLPREKQPRRQIILSINTGKI
jgi:hypothetical protein